MFEYFLIVAGSSTGIKTSRLRFAGNRIESHFVPKARMRQQLAKSIEQVRIEPTGLKLALALLAAHFVR